MVLDVVSYRIASFSKTMAIWLYTLELYNVRGFVQSQQLSVLLHKHLHHTTK